MQRAWRKLHWVEIALAVFTFLTALWQLMVIDRQMLGFILFWIIGPVIAIWLHLKRLAGAAAWWATTYLLLMCAGNVLLPVQSVLPHFRALHPADTDFARKWNQLDWASRRIISWNMTLMGASMFWFIGYAVFWLDLRRRQQFGFSKLSPPTCCFGLLVVWVLPAISLLYLVLDAIRQQP